MSNTVKLVKLLQDCRTKIFSPISVTNRSFHAFKLLNVPLLRRNNVCLASTGSWYNHSPPLLTNYTNFPAYSFLSTSTTATPTTNDLKITPIKKADTERVLQFLRRFFFRDEPLNIDLNLFPTAETICPELEEVSVNSIVDEVSFMATAHNGDIAGVCHNGIINRNEHAEEDFYCTNEKFAKILKLLNTIDKEANIFGKFLDVNKIFNMKIISIHSAFRGSRFSEAFVARNWALAREHNCTLMRGDCTSFPSARVLARLGYECIYRLKYEDYKEGGKPVFHPKLPHEAATVYIQRLTN